MRRRKDTDAPECPAVCAFCEKAILLDGQEQVLCKHRGIVDPEHHCRKFSYDPLKRVPMAPPQPMAISKEDLTL